MCPRCDRPIGLVHDERAQPSGSRQVMRSPVGDQGDHPGTATTTSPRRRRRGRILIVALAALALIGGGGWTWWSTTRTDPAPVSTAALRTWPDHPTRGWQVSTAQALGAPCTQCVVWPVASATERTILSVASGDPASDSGGTRTRLISVNTRTGAVLARSPWFAATSLGMCRAATTVLWCIVADESYERGTADQQANNTIDIMSLKLAGLEVMHRTTLGGTSAGLPDVLVDGDDAITAVPTMGQTYDAASEVMSVVRHRPGGATVWAHKVAGSEASTYLGSEGYAPTMSSSTAFSVSGSTMWLKNFTTDDHKMVGFDRGRGTMSNASSVRLARVGAASIALSVDANGTTSTTINGTGVGGRLLAQMQSEATSGRRPLVLTRPNAAGTVDGIDSLGIDVWSDESAKPMWSVPGQAPLALCGRYLIGRTPVAAANGTGSQAVPDSTSEVTDYVYDLRTGRRVASFTSTLMSTLVCAPDDRVLQLAAKKIVTVQLSTGRSVMSQNLPSATMLAVAPDAEGVIVTGSQGVELWH